MITVSEAHRRWGDLAKIERGVTRWMSVEVREGIWKPVFDETGILLLGYEFQPRAPQDSHKFIFMNSQLYC